MRSFIFCKYNQSAGIPVQAMYSKNVEEEKPIMGRLALHSLNLSFSDSDGTIYQLEAEIPKDMRATLQQLRKWKS